VHILSLTTDLKFIFCFHLFPHCFKNKNVKLAKLPDGSAEIFHTLQGEGINTGKAAIFIRSSLCNLHCIWCDTAYTWNWEKTPWQHEDDRKFKKEEQILELSIEEISKQIQQYLPCTHLVLTGGEPLLQQDDWNSLLSFLNESRPYTAEVETNGTLIPNEPLDQWITQYNVSPKLHNSNNEEKNRIKPEALEWFSKSKKAWFKFVVSQESDYQEIQNLIGKHSLPKERIILMPEGRTPEILTERRLWLAEKCRLENLRFGDRLHVHLWGPKRGV